jgi:hypothetical protein
MDWGQSVAYSSLKPERCDEWGMASTAYYIGQMWDTLPFIAIVLRNGAQILMIFMVILRGG